MDAILSIENDEGGWRAVGTKGRSVVRNATRRKLIDRAAALQRAWHGRAVRIEECDGGIYTPTSRTWIYHCACDLDRPCQFHAEIQDVRYRSVRYRR